MILKVLKILQILKILKIGSSEDSEGPNGWLDLQDLQDLRDIRDLRDFIFERNLEDLGGLEGPIDCTAKIFRISDIFEISSLKRNFGDLEDLEDEIFKILKIVWISKVFAIFYYSYSPATFLNHLINCKIQKANSIHPKQPASISVRLYAVSFSSVGLECKERMQNIIRQLTDINLILFLIHLHTCINMYICCKALKYQIFISVKIMSKFSAA